MGFIALNLHLTILVGMTQIPAHLNSHPNEFREQHILSYKPVISGGLQKGEEGKPNSITTHHSMLHEGVQQFGYTNATQVQKLIQTRRRISQKCKCVIPLRTRKSWLGMQRE